MFLAKSLRAFWSPQAQHAAVAALSALAPAGRLPAVLCLSPSCLYPRTTLNRQCSAYTSSQAYQNELERLRRDIFGTHIGNNLPSGRKLLRKPLIGDKIANYYIESFSKTDHLYVDERIERNRAKLDKLKRRGKGPPKKGQGKRAGKRR